MLISEVGPRDGLQSVKATMPVLRSYLADFSASTLSDVFEKNGLPFAPITRPQDLFEDPHLLATGGLAPLQLPDGRATRVSLMPITLGGDRPGVRSNPPGLGEHSAELLAELGYSAIEIEAITLCSLGVSA